MALPRLPKGAAEKRVGQLDSPMLAGKAVSHREHRELGQRHLTHRSHTHAPSNALNIPWSCYILKGIVGGGVAQWVRHSHEDLSSSSQNSAMSSEVAHHTSWKLTGQLP